jgi:hypothetical protein
VIIIDPIGLQGCSVRDALFEQEKRLRSAAKNERDWMRAAELANEALEVQRARHRHSVGCELCLRLEPPEGATA